MPPNDKSKLLAAETWIFDLDNTLYPASCNLFAQVDRKMGDFISSMLNIPYEDARALQKSYFREHGTTLRGLMQVHEIDPADFLDYVHDIDYSPVTYDEALGEALSRLPGRKLIFTNGTVAHADSVLGQLGAADHFDLIYDIVASDYIPKPNPAPYDKMIAEHDIDPTTSVMVEDIAKNLMHPAAIGMQTVWVRTDTDWAKDDDDPADYIHHETDDLSAWLSDLVAT